MVPDISHALIDVRRDPFRDMSLAGAPAEVHEHDIQQVMDLVHGLKLKVGPRKRSYPVPSIWTRPYSIFGESPQKQGLWAGAIES